MITRSDMQAVHWHHARRAAASREWPEDFFAEATDMLCVAGVDGYFKALNPAWSRILGWSLEELLARPYVEFVHPDDRAATVAEASKIAAGQPTVQFRNRYRSVDGSYRWLSWTATAALIDGAIYASAREVAAAVEGEDTDERHRREAVERTRRVHAVLDGDGPRIVLQPIFSLQSGVVHGFEALSRFDAYPERPPHVWYADAASVGLGAELELRAIANAVAVAQHLPPRVFMSVNVSPSTLTSMDLEETLAAAPRERLVLEITEHAAVADYAVLTGALQRIRECGARLAIDDAGAGYSGLTQIVQMVPEFIKLDRFLLHGIDSEPVKRALAAALVRFAADIGASLIAEGVETAQELRALQELRVPFAQGFFLGRPLPAPTAPMRDSPPLRVLRASAPIDRLRRP